MPIITVNPPTIPVAAPLSVVVTATPTARGASLAAVVSNGSGAYAYQWSGVGAWVGGLTGPTASVQVYTAGPATVTVTVTDTTYNQSVSETATFTVAQVPTTVTIIPVAPFAIGVPQQLTPVLSDQFAHPITGGSFAWYCSTGAVTQGGVYTATAAGTPTVTITSGSLSSTVNLSVIATVSIAVVWPFTLVPKSTQSVTIAYTGATPSGSAPIAVSAGSLIGDQVVSGQMVSLSLGLAASADTAVTFTDVATGARTTATVGATLVSIRHIGIGFHFKNTPGKVDIPSPIPGGLRFSNTGPNRVTMVRLDTGAPVAIPNGTPFLKNSASSFFYEIVEDTPNTIYQFFYTYRNENGVIWQNDDTWKSAPATPTIGNYFSVPPGLPPGKAKDGLTSDQAAQLGSIAAGVSQLSAGHVQYTGPVAPDGNTVRIVQGDDVALRWAFSNYTGPSLTGAVVRFGLMLRCDYDTNPAAAASLTVTGTFASATAADGSTTVTYTIPLAAGQTAGLPPTPIDRPLNMVGQLIVTTADGKRQTPVLAAVTVSRRVV